MEQFIFKCSIDKLLFYRGPIWGWMTHRCPLSLPPPPNQSPAWVSRQQWPELPGAWFRRGWARQLGSRPIQYEGPETLTAAATPQTPPHPPPQQTSSAPLLTKMSLFYGFRVYRVYHMYWPLEICILGSFFQPSIDVLLYRFWYHLTG